MSESINTHSNRPSNDMCDLDKDNSSLAATMDNDMAASILTAKRAPLNLASDWPSADCAKDDRIDHGMDNDDDQDDGDDPAEQEQFNRISGILSQLIQEANNAINSPSSLSSRRASTPIVGCDDDDDDDENDLMAPTPNMEDGAPVYSSWCAPTMDDILSEAGDDFNNMDDDTLVRSASPVPIQLPLYKPQVMMERTVSASTSTTFKDSRRRSRLPRPKRLSLDIIQQYHHHHHPPPPPSYHNRSSSTMSVSSSSSSLMDYDDDLFSPLSSSLTTPMSRTISPLLFEKGLYTQVSRQGSTTSHETDLGSFCDRAVQNYKQSQHPHQRDDDNEMEDDDDEYASSLQGNDGILMSSNGSLLASFERLDSSLAIVDSLSRDLANYRRQHPRQRNSATDIHPMIATSQCNIPTDTIFDSPTSAHPLEEAAAASITTPSDDNIYAGYQHYDRRSSGSRKWLTILLVGPILYIPYLLMASIWEQIIVATELTTTTTTATAPFSLLLSTASAMMFDDRHTFASLKSTLITTITSTAMIGNGGGGDMVPPCIGLAVFLLFLAILHLLKSDCATMDEDRELVIDTECRQFINTSSYHDLSNKMIRRSSLPIVPCSPSISRRNSS